MLGKTKKEQNEIKAIENWKRSGCWLERFVSLHW
jgi:hypothetical protein